MDHDDEATASAHEFSASNALNAGAAGPNEEDDKEKRRLQHRAELLNQFTREQKAQYERICKLRDAIGSVDFKVVDLIRELRGDD